MSGSPARAPRRAPRSTYRVQVREGFDLDAVRDLLPYLDALGVDWVYLSPILAAHPGSDHGYDVVDPARVDPARGGPDALRRLADDVHARGMGVLVDVVPNHVGVASPATNGWWWDLLAHGRASRYAGFFDVDWDAGDGRVLLPVVGDDDLVVSPEGGTAIEHLRLVDGELAYHEHRFPVAPGTLGGEQVGDDDPQAVHARQHYRLVGWRSADEYQNYRRFFAVTTLAGVRVEHRDVFEATHAEVGRWFADGLVDGLRVDHPDGLRHPAAYLDDLAGLTDGAHVLVEKILEPGEELPPRWATAGTTGYEVLALIDRVLVDPAGEQALTDLDARLRGAATDWPALVRDSKRHVASGILHAEVRRIARELAREWAADGGPPDRGDPVGQADQVDQVLVELLAAFDVYRTYLPEGRERLDAAAAAVRSTRPDLTAALDDVLPLLADRLRAPSLRLQQTSGMVMAKGVEDRAFYRWSRLSSLCEVGADPAAFAVTPADLHVAMARRQELRPDAMTTLSTHDTKRGEDVRARLAVLAETPDRWESCVQQVLAAVPALPVEDAGFVNLLLQAAVGAWPISAERLHAYAEKAMREADEHTGWGAPESTYEDAVHAVVDAVLDPGSAAGRAVAATAEALADPGWSNGLAARLLSLTLPGAPDVYQGSELWEQSLVDPDNRRPVDHDLRRRLLTALDEPGAVAALAAPTGLEDDGRTKLHVVRSALRLRRERPEAFTRHTPVAAHGDAADHVIAFDRGAAITVVTRLPVGLARRGGWGSTRLDLPAGRWHDLMADRPVGPDAVVGDLLDRLPVALLVPADPATNPANTEENP